eukprot:6723945-Prorocentrum_lima.AAC.1
MVRLADGKAVRRFVEQWNSKAPSYQGEKVWARKDTPLIHRRANSRVWQMAQYLQSTFATFAWDRDFSRKSVWTPYGELC